jgi:hypothetical protein
MAKQGVAPKPHTAKGREIPLSKKVSRLISIFIISRSVFRDTMSYHGISNPHPASRQPANVTMPAWLAALFRGMCTAHFPSSCRTVYNLVEPKLHSVAKLILRSSRHSQSRVSRRGARLLLLIANCSPIRSLWCIIRSGYMGSLRNPSLE